MSQRTYRTGEFARKTSVSVRTLRFYDQTGLLPASGRTEAGYRLYTDADLARLQQILALKFLGFSLDEIRTYLEDEPRDLDEALAEQQAMVMERRRQLDAVGRAIGETRTLLRADGCDWAGIVRVIRVIQMEQQDDWRRKYFTEEQLATIQHLSDSAYSDEARQRLAELHPNPWTEEDQRRIDARYDVLHSNVKRFVREGADPGTPEAQALAKESLDLIQAFTGGDPLVSAGLQQWWQGFQALPEEQRPFQPPLTSEEQKWLDRAKALYRESNRG